MVTRSDTRLRLASRGSTTRGAASAAGAAAGRCAEAGGGAETAGCAEAGGWLKLTRTGDTFTAFVSADGVSWTPAGSITVALGSTVYVGLAVTSHNPGAVNTATFDSVSVG